MITVGGVLENASWRVSPPRMVINSSLTILATCWAGFSAPDTSAPLARSLMRATKSRTTGNDTPASSRAHRRQRPVGFEQRQPNLAGRRIDAGVGQPPLAAQPLQGAGQPVGERFKH